MYSHFRCSEEEAACVKAAEVISVCVLISQINSIFYSVVGYILIQKTQIETKIRKRKEKCCCSTFFLFCTNLQVMNHLNT